MPQNVLGLSPSKVLIITGESGSGKTTALANLIEQCQQQGLPLRGMLCPGEMKDGKRFSSDLLDIATNERCLFGHRTGVLDKQTGTRFTFTEEGIALGKLAFDHNKLNQGGVCIVDEIGPMELKGQGFGEHISPLLSIANSRHIWVVRPSLIESVSRHWSLNNPQIINVEDAELAHKLMRFVDPDNT